MSKKINKKGFTLAELLIVVAIIAVLVAISIPVFTSQLEKAKEATDLANIRSAYAEVMSDALTNGTGAASKTIAMSQSDLTKWTTASPKVGDIALGTPAAYCTVAIAANATAPTITFSASAPSTNP